MEDRINIIFAEDNERFRKSIISELESYNIFTVSEAADGKELILQMTKHTSDVILLDLEMPVMDGNKAYSIIHNRFPSSKVFVLSQHDEDGMMENYIERGVKGYLPKQFVSSDVSVLARGIRAVYKGESFYYTFDSSNKKSKYTKREAEIIPLICNGKTTREISNELGLAEKTVEGHRNRLYKKTSSRNTAEFLKYCFKKGLEFLGK
jgi:DNA-binding NarL/FixJ family response regulator